MKEPTINNIFVVFFTPSWGNSPCDNKWNENSIYFNEQQQRKQSSFMYRYIRWKIKSCIFVFKSMEKRVKTKLKYFKLITYLWQHSLTQLYISLLFVVFFHCNIKRTETASSSLGNLTTYFCIVVSKAILHFYINLELRRLVPQLNNREDDLYYEWIFSHSCTNKIRCSMKSKLQVHDILPISVFHYIDAYIELLPH